MDSKENWLKLDMTQIGWEFKAAGDTNIVYVFQTSISDPIKEIFEKTAGVRTGCDITSLYSILGLTIPLQQHKVDLYD